MNSRPKRLLALAVVLGCCVILCVIGIWFSIRKPSGQCRDENITGSLSNQQLAWTITTEHGIAYPALALDNTIAVVDLKDQLWSTTDAGVVYAYEEQSGAFLWRYPPNNTTDYIDSIKASSQYIALSIRNDPNQNKVVVLDAHTGKSILEVSDTALIIAINDQVMAYENLNRGVYVYDLQTRAQRWKLPETFERSHLGLYLGDDALYLTLGLNIKSYDLLSGKILQSISQTTQSGRFDGISMASFLGDKAILTSRMHLTYLNLETGTEVWSRPIISDSKLKIDLWLPAIDSSTIYTIVDPHNLLALSKEDGSIRWTEQPDGLEQYIAPVALQKNFIYLLWSDGSLHQIDITTQLEKGILSSTGPRHLITQAAYWYYPGVTVDDDMLFVTFGCKTLYAFREENG